MTDTCNCAPTLPLIGDEAPAFTAETTQGVINFPKDYKGKWVILFSHPADFTPVCTTEFMTFAILSDEFKAMNTELVGLSVDSLSSHIAWLHEIEKGVQFRGMKNVHVSFPLIADLNMKVSKLYGMIHPNASDTKAVRAVFFIDPQSKIRTILYYPASTGRNFDEIKRILTSLQVGDAFDKATPADWEPGDDVIVPNPNTLEGACQCDQNNRGSTCAWFLSTMPLSKSKIEDKIVKKETTSKKKTTPNKKTSSAKKTPPKKKK